MITLISVSASNKLVRLQKSNACKLLGESTISTETRIHTNITLIVKWKTSYT